MNQYDPGRVTLSFRGIIITGFADETFIKAERDEDTFSKSVGAQGDVTRVRNRNKSGSVTVTLMAGAVTNDLLSAVALEDEVSGTGVGPLMVKDLNGTTMVTSAVAWIRRQANVERGTEDSNVEWVLDCEKLEIKVGGFL